MEGEGERGTYIDGRPEGSREDDRVLRDDGEVRTEVSESDLGDVDVVDQDATGPSFDETEEGEGEGRFSASWRSSVVLERGKRVEHTCCSDDTNFLSRSNGEGEVVKDVRKFRRVCSVAVSRASTAEHDRTHIEWTSSQRR